MGPCRDRKQEAQERVGAAQGLEALVRHEQRLADDVARGLAIARHRQNESLERPLVRLEQCKEPLLFVA